MMRNAARERCDAPYLLMLDADLEVFGAHMYTLSTEIAILDVPGERNVVVLATFEIDEDVALPWNNGDELEAPYASKEGIHSLYVVGKARPFEHLTYSKGHAATDFNRWFPSDEPYAITYTQGFEPCKPCQSYDQNAQKFASESPFSFLLTLPTLSFLHRPALQEQY